MIKLSRLMRVLVPVLIVAFALTTAEAQDGPKLMGAFFVKGKVGLKWNSVSGAAEYSIYRQASGGEFAKVGTTDKTNYFDTKVEPGASYVYKIAAVVNGNEILGNTKSVNIPASAGGFAAPKGFETRYDERGHSIYLKWDRVRGAIAYNILRSTTPGSGYEVVGNASTNKFIDKEDMTAGVTYYYVITALNEEFEESGYSNEGSIKYGLSDEEIAAIKEAESNIKLDSIKLDLAFEITNANNIPFESPADLTVNSKGDIYLTDTNNRKVHCYDKNGDYKFSFGEKTYEEEREDPPDGSFSSPFTITIDKSDQVYVTDPINNDIQIFTPDGKFVKRIRVTSKDDEQPFRANGIVILKDGKILCTDTGNHRVLILDTDGNILTEIISSKEFPTAFPNEIAMIDDNSFAVVNPLSAKILISDLNGKILKIFGELGTSIGTFARPVGITTSEEGLIWISDGMAATIQAFTHEGEEKIAINRDKISDENLKLNNPRGILVKDGRIYVVNRGNGKLLVYNYEITKTE